MKESSASFKNDFDEKLQLLEDLKIGILERLSSVNLRRLH